MNSMNDERFFDLAMKVITQQATDGERAELDARLVREPELAREFERLQAEVRVARDSLPLLNATEATAGELPAYARGRLQTKVRQTLGRPETAAPLQNEKERSAMWVWRWALGLTAATAVVVLVLIPMFNPSPKLDVQVAMLDVAGDTRGGDTNEVPLLQQAWTDAKIDSFTQPELLRLWETNWPAKADVVKIIYDRNAAEVRVLGRWNGKAFQKTFQVETNLTATLAQARDFVQEQTKR